MRRSIVVLVSGLVCALHPADASEPSDPFQFFQEEGRIVIATQREQPPEEAPSIVSVITRAEIERYGARDLADIMRLVPGFELSVDLFSIVGLTSRGISVNEGKALILINGISQNDLGFGNINLIGSFPASMIEKVEIVRGPGSTLYGGFAEVAVINVLTHQAKNLNGLRLSTDLGVGAKGGISRNANASYGHQTDSLRVTGHVGYGTTVLSRKDYTDFFGGRLNLSSENAYRTWQHVFTEASSKGVTLRYQRTSIVTGAQDAIAAIQPPVNGILVEQLSMVNDTLHLEYESKISDRLTLRPVFEYRRDNAESFNYPSAIAGNYAGSGLSFWRYRGELSALYMASASARVRFGGGYIRDDVESVGADGTPGLQSSADPASVTSRLHTGAGFGLIQYEQQFRAVGITFGSGYEDTTFGDAFAPRAGLTYVRKAFNAKLLYGRAFRIPTLWQAYGRNTTVNPHVEPETADTTELEGGYKWSPNVKSSLNLFFIDIRDPITYTADTNSFRNLGRIQSRGVEVELRADYLRFGGFANFNYAVPGEKTSPEFVTFSKKRFLASPPVKIAAGTYLRAGRFEYAPSVTYLSRRAGQSEASAQDLLGITKETTDYAGVFLFDMNVIARSALKTWDIHFGVRNLFDTRYVLIQPYYGSHAPMPANDREIDLGASWHF